MLFLYATYYDILIGKKSENEFKKRYEKLEMRMFEDEIDIPYTVDDLHKILNKLYDYTLEDEELYFCVMTDKNYNYHIIKDQADKEKVDIVANEFKRRLNIENIDIDKSPKL